MRLLFALITLSILSAKATALTLTEPISNTLFVIDPNTLATHARLANGTELQISPSLNKYQASEITQTESKVQWQRDNTHIEVLIDGDSFVIRFKRENPGEIAWPQTPSGAKALILPLSEGNYIPAMNAQWRTALQEEYQNINTTQDLSLPLIGFDYGQAILSIIYANPFNNNLHFKADEKGISVTSTHSFLSFNQKDTFEVRIGINQNDLLAPAKRFRT